MTTFKKFLVPIFFIGLLFFVKLGTYPLHTPDGARYAEIPREMSVTHDYITPHLNGLPYLEKPPFFYWLQTLSIKTFGANDFAVSLPNALMGFLCCLVVFFTARKIYGHLQGVLSCVILATSALFFALTRIVTLDMTLTAFLTMSLASFILGVNQQNNNKQKYYMRLMYVFAALATMVKGLIGAFFPPIIILLWIIIFKEWSNIKKYCIPTGLIIFLIIVLPWHILVELKNPGFFKFYFFEQHFLRYFTTYSSRGAPFGFLFIALAAGFFPWTFFVLQAIKNTFLQYKNEQVNLSYQYKASVFFIIWAGFILLFYSFSNSKLITYLLPIFPPLAIIVGCYCANKIEKSDIRTNEFYISIMIISIVFVVSGLGLFVVSKFINFSKESFDIHFLYKEELLLFCGGLLIFICNHFDQRKGLFALIIITSGMYYFANPVITIINNKSIKPLAIILQQRLQPNDEVVCYDYYYQDLPFYIQRTVDIVNYKGELQYGMQNVKNSNQWMLSFDVFFKKWNSNKKMYMIIEKNKYEELLHEQKISMYILYRYLDKLLVTNLT